MSATTQQYSLRWNNYVNHLTYAFDSLRHTEDLVDVTLSCEGRKIRAHKVILSACSTYFREVFQENPCQHPVIVFKNVRHEDLSAIIEFIYQGEVHVLQDSLPSFLNTAELLAVQGLTEGDKDERETQVLSTASSKPKIVQTSGIVTRLSSGSSSQVGVKESQRISLKTTPVTVETPQPKRKRFYIDSDDNIAFESINFVKPTIIGNANVEFTPMKIDIPEYIDISATADEGATGTDEVLIEERSEETHGSVEEHGDDSQDQDDMQEDTKPQIIAMKTVSDVEEQSYVEGDSAEISASEYEQSSKYSRENPAKYDAKSGQDAQLRFRCNLCFKGFKHPMSLTLHRDMHDGKTDCPVCERKFSRSYDMRTHLNKIHKLTLNFDAKFNVENLMKK